MKKQDSENLKATVPSEDELDNVEYFYYFDSMATNDAIYDKNSMVSKAKADSSPSNGT